MRCKSNFLQSFSYTFLNVPSILFYIFPFHSLFSHFLVFYLSFFFLFASISVVSPGPVEASKPTFLFCLRVCWLAFWGGPKSEKWGHVAPKDGFWRSARSPGGSFLAGGGVMPCFLCVHKLWGLGVRGGRGGRATRDERAELLATNDGESV